MNISRRKFLGSAVILAAHGILKPKLSWAADKAVANQTGRTPAAKKVSISYFTDIHANLDGQIQPALVKAASALKESKTDFLICGGDFIRGGPSFMPENAAAEWQRLQQFQDEIGKPFIQTIGNHDFIGLKPPAGMESIDPRADYLKHFGLKTTYFRKEVSGYQIFTLDSMELVGGGNFRGSINQQQQDWIKTELSQISPEQPIIIVTHLPFITALFQATKGGTAAGSESKVVANSDQILTLFSNHNLVLVLQGHLHVSEILVWRQTTFITGGAICGNWWKGTYQGTPEGFGEIQIANNQVTWHYHPYGYQAP